MNQNNNNPPPYTLDEKILPIASEPFTMYSMPTDRQSLPKKEELKPKARTIIPFIFVDIDITDFPSIKFIKN
jgi:hypothetical protein